MQATRPRFGHDAHDDLPEWRAATRFAAAVDALLADLDVPAELVWLEFLLERSGRAVAEVIADAWGREFLAEYLLGLTESLDHVLLFEYYLLFLRGQALIDRARVDALDDERRALQTLIEAAAAELRRTWADEFRGGVLGPPPPLGPPPTC